MFLRKFLGAALLLLPIIGLSNPNADLIRKAGDSKKYSDNHLLVLYDSTKVKVKPSGLSYYYTHKLYKVLTQKGALGVSVIKYDYDPLTAYVDIVRAVVYRNDGSIEEIDVKKALDYPAPARSIYWGAREKMLEIGRLEPGDGLEVMLFKKGFSYALLDGGDDERYAPPMFGHFYDIVPFWSDDASKTYMMEKVYHLTLPSDKKLLYRFYYGEVQESKIEEGANNIYIFTKKDIKPFNKEPFMVSLYDVAPKLLLSTSPDWQSKSKWFYKVNEDFGSFEATAEIKKKTDDILKGAKDEMDSVSRLTHWVADEIRYSGLSMGKGEGFTLHKGSMTFTDRCGVCKDKAGMLITMLRAAGFESYAAMTMAGSRIDEIPADHFNHCVTAVKLKDGKIHMLDPTWVPFRRELWSSAEQQQNYLIGTADGSPLMEIPISPPENHYVNFMNDAELSNDGTLKGQINITADGQSDAAVRSLFTSSYRAQWKSNVEKEFLEAYPQGKVVSSEYGDPWDYMKSPVSITINYVIPDFAVLAGDDMIFKSMLATNIFRRAQNHLNFDTTLVTRKYAFRDRCSRLVKISDNIKLPSVKSIVNIPAEKKTEGNAASFAGKYSINDNIIKYESEAVFGKRVYENSDWKDYRNSVAAQSKLNNEKVILQYK